MSPLPLPHPSPPSFSSRLAQALYHLQRSPLLGSACSEAQRITERHLYLSASLPLALPLLIPRLLLKARGAQSFVDVPPADLAIAPDAALLLDHGTSILIWMVSLLCGVGRVGLMAVRVNCHESSNTAGVR